jgi:hypothetical protein
LLIVVLIASRNPFDAADRYLMEFNPVNGQHIHSQFISNTTLWGHSPLAFQAAGIDPYFGMEFGHLSQRPAVDLSVTFGVLVLQCTQVQTARSLH